MKFLREFSFVCCKHASFWPVYRFRNNPARPRHPTGMMTLFAFLFLAADAVAPVYQSKGVAISGYDPVAYFDGQPTQGKSEYSTDWNGARWLFSNAANRDRFEKEPARFGPQFGGYCAWAVGHGYTYKTDPLAWSVIDGKLYLNYDQKVRSMWLPEAGKWIRQGEQNWPRLHR
jgi:YHS domain-containing protein